MSFLVKAWSFLVRGTWPRNSLAGVFSLAQKHVACALDSQVQCDIFGQLAAWRIFGGKRWRTQVFAFTKAIFLVFRPDQCFTFNAKLLEQIQQAGRNEHLYDRR